MPAKISSKNEGEIRCFQTDKTGLVASAPELK